MGKKFHSPFEITLRNSMIGARTLKTIEEIKEKETICDECDKPMTLQGVGSYFEEGKELRGTMYYFCCKKWKAVAD